MYYGFPDCWREAVTKRPDPRNALS
jgi:hypothetical protein